MANGSKLRLEQEIESPERRTVLRAGLGLFAAALGYKLMACGDDNPGQPDTLRPDSGVHDGTPSTENPLDAIDASKVTPSNGAKYTYMDKALPWGFTTPGKNPSYSGSAPTSIDVKVTASGDSAGGSKWTKTLEDKQGVALGQSVSGSLELKNPSTGKELADGEKITLDYVCSAKDTKGQTQTRSAKVEVTYQAAPKDRPYVKSFTVLSASVGKSIVIDCYGEDLTGGNLLGNWKLQSDLNGALIVDIDPKSATITKQGVADQSAVGLYTHTVACGNGSKTSDAVTIKIPVDEHYSALKIVSGGQTYDLLLQESTVDAFAKNAGSSAFNSANKPKSKTESTYILGLDVSKLQAAYATISAEEKANHRCYKDGDKLATILAGATSAQVSYRSDK